VTAGARNVISGNAGAGVLIHDAATTGNVVEGNYVGLKFQGSGPLANGWGVIINGAAHDNIIGGTTAGARNVISANTNDGVQISGAGTTGNLVEGDYIGIDFAGLGGPFVHNGGFGVNVSGASGNTIGGTAPGAGNVISNNARDGVYIHDVSGPSGGAANNVVQGTYIGTNAAGMASLGNNGVGVHIVGSSGNTIGGSTMAARNIVSGNGGVGIQISDSLSTGNVIAGNYIGSDVTV
jgi:titin